ncbi:MAG: hypothetical protein KAU31_04120, partial [Spirochaetaceae bacterium]|nr:hypothetical protein [Spirochaetaceae bacterium]
MGDGGSIAVAITADTSSFMTGLAKATVAAGAFTGLLVAGATKAAGDFEQAIVNAGARSNASAAQIDKLAG